MKKVRNLRRVDLVKSVFGVGSRLTEGRQCRALTAWQGRGYQPNLPDFGPAFEVVTFVAPDHPLQPVVADVRSGNGIFHVTDLESRLEEHPFLPTSVHQLSRVGLAITSCDGEYLTLRAVDVRAARMINAARLGVARRGFLDRAVIEAFLLVRDPERRWLRVTDDRRLAAAWVLSTQWDIDCEDLLSCQRYVHLISRWFLPPVLRLVDRMTA